METSCKKLSELLSEKQKQFLFTLPDWEVVLSDEDNSIELKPRLASRWYDGTQLVEKVCFFVDFCQKVNDIALYFDCSYEAYLLLDETGHEKKGIAPSYMGDVLFATEELAEKLDLLTVDLANYLAKEDKEETA